MKRLLLSILVFLLIFPSAVALVDESVTHVFTQTDSTSSYRQILSDGGVDILPPYYTLEKYIIGEDPEDEFSIPHDSPSELPGNFFSVELDPETYSFTVSLVTDEEEVSKEGEVATEEEVVIPEGAFLVGELYTFSLGNLKDLLVFNLGLDESPVFQFHLTDPYGNKTVYYDLPTFKIYDATPGLYSFQIISEDIIFYDLTLESRQWGIPENASGTLLIEPDQSFSEELIEEISLFVEQGGSLILISNSDVAEAFDVYFDSSYFDQDLTLEETNLGFSSFIGSQINLVENDPPNNNCVDIPHIKTTDGSLFTRFYCLRESGDIHTLSFISQDAFESDPDGPIRQLLISGLFDPYNVLLKNFLPTRKDIIEFSLLENQVLLRMLFIAGFFIFFFVFFFSKVHLYCWKRLKVMFSYLRIQIDRNHQVDLFWVFVFLSLLSLYNTFFFHRWIIGFTLITIVLGGLVFLICKYSTLSLTPGEKKHLRIYHSLIVFVPILMIIVFFTSSARPSYEKTLSLIPLDVQNGGLSLMNTHDSNVDSATWGIPGGALYFTRMPFWIAADLPSSPFIKDDQLVQLRVKFKSNASLEIQSLEDSSGTHSRSLFSSFLSDFSVIKTFDSIMVARKSTSPLINPKPTSDNHWITFLKDNFDSHTSFGILFDSVMFDPDHFWDPDFDLIPPATESTFPLNIALTGSSFYTYLFEDLNLSIDFEDISTDQSLKLTITDSLGNVVFNVGRHLHPEQGTQTFSVNKKDVEEGIYEFHFEFEEVDLENPPTISDIHINSPKLVLQTETLDMNRVGHFYFKNLSGASFEYSSPLSSLPFSALAGASIFDSEGNTLSDFSEINTGPDDIFYSVFSPIEASLNASSPTLFSFSEESWFNPFQFNFTPSIASTDYAILEDYYGPFDEEDGWIWFDDTFQIRSSTGTAHFQMDFLGDQSDSWLMIKNIEIIFL